VIEFSLRHHYFLGSPQDFLASKGPISIAPTTAKEHRWPEKTIDYQRLSVTILFIVKDRQKSPEISKEIVGWSHDYQSVGGGCGRCNQ
jgi:hypothetical protein